MAMHELSDKIEELLEHLWIRIEEEKQEAVTSLIRDNEEFRQLRDMGLVEVEEQTVRFTAQGREQARECVRRHRLAERLLSDILAGTEEQIHAAGCKFEHGRVLAGRQMPSCTPTGPPRLTGPLAPCSMGTGKHRERLGSAYPAVRLRPGISFGGSAGNALSHLAGQYRVVDT